MKPSRLLSAAVVTLVSISAWGRQAGVEGTRTWTLPGFTLYAPDAASASTVAEQFEPIQRAMAAFMGSEPAATGIPLHIYVANNSVWQRYLRPDIDSRVASIFVPTRFADYLLINPYFGGSEWKQELNQQLAHHFLRNLLRGEIPLWFSAGFAKLVGPTQIRGKLFEIGMAVRRVDTPWITMDRVLRLDATAPEFVSVATHTFHYRAWTLVHRGLIDDREFGGKLFKYLDAINDGVAVDDAVAKAFGVSVAELDQQMQSYGRQISFRTAEIPFDPVPKLKLDAGRKMSDLESVEVLAGILLTSRAKVAALGELIDAAEQMAPGSPATRLLRLRQAAVSGTDAELAEALRVASPQLSEPVASRTAGVSLLNRLLPQLSGEARDAPDVRSKAHQAFELLHRSEHALPVDAESAWAYGMVAAWLGDDTEFALQRVAASQALLPLQAELAMASAALLEKMGRFDEEIDQLVQVGKAARSFRQKLWAAQKIAELQKRPRK